MDHILTPACKYIAENEGFCDTVYKDSLGFDTIGYGFKLHKSIFTESKIQEYKNGCCMKRDTADNILRTLVTHYLVRVRVNFSWFNGLPLTAQIVMIDLAYNLGISGLKKHQKFLAFMEKLQFKEASEELLDSKYAKQVPNRAKKNSDELKGIFDERIG